MRLHAQPVGALADSLSLAVSRGSSTTETQSRNRSRHLQRPSRRERVYDASLRPEGVVAFKASRNHLDDILECKCPDEESPLPNTSSMDYGRHPLRFTQPPRLQYPLAGYLRVAQTTHSSRRIYPDTSATRLRNVLPRPSRFASNAGEWAIGLAARSARCIGHQ